jgi:hypothetical protein
MKRAAEEFTRTKNVWRQHLRAHQGAVACVCEFQIGRFRKGQRIGGCGHSKCWVCHSEKLGREPTLQHLRSVANFLEGLAEASSLSNNALEADPGTSWPHRARNGLRARRCGDASWRAAQFNR